MEAVSKNVPKALSRRLETIQFRKREDLVVAEPVRLSKERVHEVTGEAADLFAVAAAARTSGPIIWIGLARDVGSLAPTSVQSFLDPARIILAICVSRTEILWSAEQALRSPTAACVVAEIGDGPDLRESRRLQIAAEEGGSIGLVLISGRTSSSAAETRWQCETSSEADLAWVWTLIKNRKGKLGAWQARWNGKKDAQNAIHLVSATAA